MHRNIISRKTAQFSFSRTKHSFSSTEIYSKMCSAHSLKFNTLPSVTKSTADFYTLCVTRFRVYKIE